MGKYEWMIPLGMILGIIGPIGLLLTLGFGTLFAGFALWQLIGFVSAWMPVLVAGGIGILVLRYFIVGGHPIIGLVALLILVVMGFAVAGKIPLTFGGGKEGFSFLGYR